MSLDAFVLLLYLIAFIAVLIALYLLYQAVMAKLPSSPRSAADSLAGAWADSVIPEGASSAARAAGETIAQLAFWDLLTHPFDAVGRLFTGD